MTLFKLRVTIRVILWRFSKSNVFVSFEINAGNAILAKLHTAVSLLSEYSMISVHWDVRIPLKIPACAFGSVKQYESSIKLLWDTDNIRTFGLICIDAFSVSVKGSKFHWNVLNWKNLWVSFKYRICTEVIIQLNRFSVYSRDSMSLSWVKSLCITVLIPHVWRRYFKSSKKVREILVSRIPSSLLSNITTTYGSIKLLNHSIFSWILWLIGTYNEWCVSSVIVKLYFPVWQPSWIAILSGPNVSFPSITGKSLWSKRSPGNKFCASFISTFPDPSRM